MSERKSKVCLIFTGGTIAMDIASNDHVLAPTDKPPDILKQVPELSEIVNIDAVFVCNIDSSNMTPKEWVRIAQAIYERWDDFDGFVVTHGTDTMAYTASALSFLLQGIDKPIVLTGSQVPLSSHPISASDARNNLINAFLVAAHENVTEVCIVFASKILRGNRATKINEFEFEAFTSFNLAPLGRIGLGIKMNDHCIHRQKPSIRFAPNLNEHVMLLKAFPGIQGDVVSTVLLERDYEGIVLEAFGAGNLPLSLVDPVASAVRAGVAVVICTQCQVGAVELFYETSKKFLDVGAISALDMTPEATYTKLMWALAQTKDLKEIKYLMQKNLAGEICAAQ